uniref:Uncharacterized protein n=1 Tax=Hyaloperonospora arabidopsidis (strain Emoy2) TaxID=559515 RepID=M4B775_HYAAE
MEIENQTDQEKTIDPATIWLGGDHLCQSGKFIRGGAAGAGRALGEALETTSTIRV